MTDNTLQAELDFALAMAASAGTRVKDLRETGRWEGRMLADIGDQAADGYLRGALEGRYPEDGVLSEETADTAARLSRSRAWIIDPLDGTREFSQLRDDWAVHVALTIDHACAMAVVGLPSQGRTIWGISTPDAERSGLIGPGTLHRGEDAGPDQPRIACSRSHTPDWMDEFHGQLAGGELVRAGSAGNKVALLLLGEADVYVHKKGLKEWDTCAPETIARAMGWTVCKLRGDEHSYNREDPKNHELVVCRPAWRQRVLAALASCGALEA